MPLDRTYERRTMEVVLPQGDIFKTGTASAANTEEAYPEGPGIDFYRLFQGAQGTLGIVTWLNIKTECRPKHQKVFFIPFKRIEDAADPIYRIQRRHVGNECFLLNNFNLARLLADEWPKDFEDYREKLPPYTLTVVIAGAPRRPLERIAYEEEALNEIAAELLFQPAATVAGIGTAGHHHRKAPLAPEGGQLFATLAAERSTFLYWNWVTEFSRSNDKRRYFSRGRGLRSAHHRLLGGRVQEGSRNRPAQGSHGVANGSKSRPRKPNANCRPRWRRTSIYRSLPPINKDPSVST